MSLISRLHHQLESTPKDQYVEIRTSTSMEELRRLANLENIPLERLKLVERLVDGEFGLLDMEENIFYKNARDPERGFSTYGGTIMVFEDPEVKSYLVKNIGGESGITNKNNGVPGVRGIAGEVTYEQVLACKKVDFTSNKKVRRFNELEYFRNLETLRFNECSELEELSLPYMSLGGYENWIIFCSKLRKITTRYGLDVVGGSILRGNSKLSELDTSNWTISSSSTERMFEGCSSLTRLDLRNLEIDNVTIALNMFSGCSSLQTLDTSKWNLGNLNTAENMFSRTKINTLDVRGWDLRKLTNAVCMFSQTPLISLDTSGWVLNNLSNAAQMFQYCSNLITLGNTSRWGLEKLTNANAMFHQCRSLQSLDTSGWNLENVTTIKLMFDTCTALTTLGDTSRWNLIRCTDMQNLLINCNQLTKLDLTYTSTPQVVVSNLVSTLHNGNIESIVGDHTETDNVSVWNGFNSDNLGLGGFTQLNLASFLAIFRGVGTNRVRRWISLPNSIKSMIPQEYKTMLENKNWELA